MIKYIRQHQFAILLFLFILIPMIAIDTSTRKPRDYRPYDRWIITITGPIQEVIHWTLDSAVSFLQHYVFLLHTKEENIRLLEETRKLSSAVINLREAFEENKRLRGLLHFKETYKFNSVVARVVARDVATEFRSIRINRGELDGIKKDMAVVNAEGVIGRVLRTSDHTADVVTILDLLSSVDAISARSRARGIVEGMTDDSCQLKFALRTDDLQQEDLLITSGLEGIFPKGIPVGTVTNVRKRSFGITQNVEVRPSVDFSKLEEVLVVQSFDPAPVHSLEALSVPIPSEKTK